MDYFSCAIPSKEHWPTSAVPGLCCIPWNQHGTRALRYPRRWAWRV
jgi:hypothetical protein